MNLLKAARLFLGSTFHYTLTEIISGSLLIVTRPLFGGGKGTGHETITPNSEAIISCVQLFIYWQSMNMSLFPTSDSNLVEQSVTE